MSDEFSLSNTAVSTAAASLSLLLFSLLLDLSSGLYLLGYTSIEWKARAASPVKGWSSFTLHEELCLLVVIKTSVFCCFEVGFGRVDDTLVRVRG